MAATDENVRSDVRGNIPELIIEFSDSFIRRGFLCDINLDM